MDRGEVFDEAFIPSLHPYLLRQRNDKPVIAVYEARANPADHKGIRGIDGSTVSPYDLDAASAPFR